MGIKINYVNIFLLLSVLLNLFLGIVYAEQSGQIQAMKDINRLYLSAACGNINKLKTTLEGYDVTQLPIKISESERQKWINNHLSKCDEVSAK